MAYVKTEWKDGEAGGTPITAEALNNIENGIENVDTSLTSVIQQIGDIGNALDVINGKEV